MRKLVSVLLLMCVLTTSAFAFEAGLLPFGVGAKFAGMGGAGSALVDDVASAYYNPAGIVRSQAVALKVGAGAATDGLDKLTSVLGNVANPSKFLSDNYASAIDVNGQLNASLGLNMAKMGLSVIPITTLNLSKAANTITGNGSATMNSQLAYTVGFGMGIPFVGDVNLGASAKYLMNTQTSFWGSPGGVAVSGVIPAFTSVDNSTTASGVGFDIGAQASVNAIIMPINVAIVMKDLGANLKRENKTTTKTFNSSGVQTSITEGAATALADLTLPTTTVIGAATEIPFTGVKIAADLDNVASTASASSYSVTHIGVEYSLLGLIDFRVGRITGGTTGTPIDMSTVGAGLLGLLNIAMVTDNNNTKNNQTMFDFGIGF